MDLGDQDDDVYFKKSTELNLDEEERLIWDRHPASDSGEPVPKWALVRRLLLTISILRTRLEDQKAM